MTWQKYQRTRGGRNRHAPSGVNYDQILPANITVLDGEGSLRAGDGRRSSEWPMHRKIYDMTDARAVVHTHSPFATAVSTVCTEMPAIQYSILRLGGPTVPVAPYTTFGSAELAGMVGTAPGRPHRHAPPKPWRCRVRGHDRGGLCSSAAAGMARRGLLAEDARWFSAHPQH